MALRQGLRELGHVEGKNIIIEIRYAEGKLDRLPALAHKLIPATERPEPEEAYDLSRLVAR